MSNIIISSHYLYIHLSFSDRRRYPNQNNLVVYHFNPDTEAKSMDKRIGYLYVHRGLDDTSTQTVHLIREKNEVVLSDMISLYRILLTTIFV